MPTPLIMMEAQLRAPFKPVVLKLGSIEPQGFGESVSGVRRQEILSNKSKINEIHIAHFIFQSTKGSMNAFVELVGFSTATRLRATEIHVYI